MMIDSFRTIGKRAEEAILAHGGSVSPDPHYPNLLKRVEVPAELVSSSDRGAWGNLSVRVWKLSDGNFLSWDREEGALTFSSHG